MIAGRAIEKPRESRIAREIETCLPDAMLITKLPAQPASGLNEVAQAIKSLGKGTTGLGTDAETATVRLFSNLIFRRAHAQCEQLLPKVRSWPPYAARALRCASRGNSNWNWPWSHRSAGGSPADQGTAAQPQLPSRARHAHREAGNSRGQPARRHGGSARFCPELLCRQSLPGPTRRLQHAGWHGRGWRLSDRDAPSVRSPSRSVWRSVGAADSGCLQPRDAGRDPTAPNPNTAYASPPAGMSAEAAAQPYSNAGANPPGASPYGAPGSTAAADPYGDASRSANPYRNASSETATSVPAESAAGGDRYNSTPAQPEQAAADRYGTASTPEAATATGNNAYSPPAEDRYQPGNTGYAPPGVPPYSNGTTPNTVDTPRRDPYYRPGGTSDYSPAGGSPPASGAPAAEDAYAPPGGYQTPATGTP